MVTVAAENWIKSQSQYALIEREEARQRRASC